MLTSLATRVVQHHARISILPENGFYSKDKADLTDSSAHDAFADTDRPGIHLSKLPADGNAAEYKPTSDVEFRHGQEFEGGSNDPSKTVFDLDDNNVLWHLNHAFGSQNAYKVKNATIYAPFTNYKVGSGGSVSQSGFDARATFENVAFDPITDPASTHDKLFFNVQNDVSNVYKYRASYDLILKNITSKNANLVFGAQPSTNFIPKTFVQDVDSGNLVIDSQGGYYSSVRLNGTDTTSPTLLISGDNNIIENVVITGESTDAPMIQISGRNNVIRNVILRGFGTHAATIESTRPDFSFVYFAPSAENNSLENLFVNGGIEAYSGREQNLTFWSGSVVGDLDDSAGQPLAYRAAFSASSSANISRADSNGETTFVIEAYARAETGSEMFRLLPASGTSTSGDDFTVDTDWTRCRNLVSGGTSTTKLQNATDAISRNVLFANVQRWACTSMGDVNGIVFNGKDNIVKNCVFENLTQIDRALVRFVSGRNKLENVSYDGISTVSAGLVRTVTGESPFGTVEGLRTNNIHSTTAEEIHVAADTSMVLRNVVITQTTGYAAAGGTPLAIAEGTVPGYYVLIENSQFVGTTNGAKIVSGMTPVIMRNVHCESIAGGGTTADVNGAGIYTGDTDNPATSLTGGCDNLQMYSCTFKATNGRAAAIVNTSGIIEGCTLIGGTGSPGSGIQLFTALPRVQGSALSNRLPLFVKNTILRWNSSNVNTGASTDEPMIMLGGLENFTTHPNSPIYVDGLVAMPDNPALSLSSNTIVAGIHGGNDESSYFSNITVDLQGCPGNVAGTKPVAVFGVSSGATGPVAASYQTNATTVGPARVNVSNFSIRGVMTGSAAQARNILELYRAKASNVEVIGSTSVHTTNGFTNLVALYGCLLDKLVCGGVTHSSATVLLDGSPSVLTNFSITGSTSILPSEYFLNIAVAASGSIVTNGQLDVAVASSAPIFTKAAINMPSVDRSTVLSKVFVKQAATATSGAFRPMVILGDAPCRITDCEFDFNYSRTGSGDSFSGTAPVMTLNDAGANFTVDDVGQYITCYFGTNVRNNGRFLIINRISATAIQFINPFGVSGLFDGEWYITPEAITDRKTGTGDTITASGTVMSLTDSAATFTPNDVGKKLLIMGATTNTNNGEYLIEDYASPTQIYYKSVQGNANGPTEAFTGAWTIVGTKSVIQNNTFRNRSASYAFIKHNVSYVGLQKQSSISLAQGQPMVSALGSATDPAGGSTDGSVPGYFFFPNSPVSGYAWTSRPIWVTRDNSQAIVFPLTLPSESLLLSVDVICQKEGVSSSITSLTVQGYDGNNDFLSKPGSTTATSGHYFVCSRGLFHKMLEYAQYSVRVDSGNASNTYPEGIKNIIVSYFDPKTNVIW